MEALRKQLKDVKQLNLNMLATTQAQQQQLQEAEHLQTRMNQQAVASQSEVAELQAKLKDAAATKTRLEATMVELANTLKVS